MTHEEAKAWLTSRNLFPRVTPVAEPGMCNLRTETEGYMEFVHRRTEEVVVFETPTPASKCTSRPDCPCDFCVRVCAEIAEGRSKKDEEDQLAEDSSARICSPSLQGTHQDDQRPFIRLESPRNNRLTFFFGNLLCCGFVSEHVMTR